MVKITALTDEPTPVAADLVAIVDDVAVTAVTKKATLDNVLAVYDAQTATMTNKTLVAPALGTPASGVLSSCDGYPEVMGFALGDETTVLAAASTTVPVLTFHMPYGFTITAVRAGVSVVGTGAALVTVDIHEAGTTILSTKITIDASEKTSTTAATAAVISDSTIATDALMELFVDLVDTDNVAAGLKVYITGYQT
jgi:hypothetical protein